MPVRIRIGLQVHAAAAAAGQTVSVRLEAWPRFDRFLLASARSRLKHVWHIPPFFFPRPLLLVIPWRTVSKKKLTACPNSNCILNNFTCCKSFIVTLRFLRMDPLLELGRTLELGETISVDGSSAGRKYDLHKRGQVYA